MASGICRFNHDLRVRLGPFVQLHLAPLDLLRQEHFLVGSQEWHPTDVSQVQLDGIIEVLAPGP